jgi:uncharacterized protein
MTVTTTYPGVYIEEDASRSFSIRASATAVPIIAMWNIPRGPAQKFNNYLAFANSPLAGDSSDGQYIRAYFECGGGPCYVVHHSDFLTEAPKYDDVTLLVACAEPTVNSGIITLCQPGSGLFGILDGPPIITDGMAAAGFAATPCAAVYYPQLTVDWATTPIPPSVVMAALYCVSDRNRGVWKAPANIALPAGYQPSQPVTDDLQAQYNSCKAINMIRKLDNRGILVWGARTLEDSDNWRYISVRRLFNSAERDIRKAMASMIFEPNNPLTWEKVRTAITNYLHSLWLQGALVGTTEKQAYSVKIGKEVTMSDDDIAQGKMIAEVGMAAVRPAEFIILQFTQTVAEG